MCIIVLADAANPEIVDAASSDLARTLELDPAADGFLRIYLFFKGFHCVQSARVAHHFWNKGSRILASAVQSESAPRGLEPEASGVRAAVAVPCLSHEARWIETALCSGGSVRRRHPPRLALGARDHHGPRGWLRHR